MSARQRTFVLVLIVPGFGLVAPQRGHAQCDPPGPNTKCWENQDGAGDGFWNNQNNWNPSLVPTSTDNVYHLIAGTIVYDVPVGSPNSTIASYTAGGSATGLDINAGLVLNLTGKMENMGTGDYELKLKSRADMTVAGDIRFVNVTLENGIVGDETTVNVTGNVVKGDWWVPKDTRVTITGNVDASGNQTWDVGEVANNIPGGILHIVGGTVGGVWTAFADLDPQNYEENNPATQIIVDGTGIDPAVDGGDWWVHKHTHVTITGNVDATGGKVWKVGDAWLVTTGDPVYVGGVLTINGNVVGGSWELAGYGVESDPLVRIPEIIVPGVIAGGCWRVRGVSCPDTGIGVKARWTFGHITEGPDKCDTHGQNMNDPTVEQVNLRLIGDMTVLNVLPDGTVEGGRWRQCC